VNPLVRLPSVAFLETISSTFMIEGLERVLQKALGSLSELGPAARPAIPTPQALAAQDATVVY
jgi:hypothetical protein